MVELLFEAHLFESMEADEECDYDHTWIDDSSAQGGNKDNCSVGEYDSKMCKDVAIVMELMQLQVENDLHEDMEFQSNLWHALGVSVDKRDNVEMPSQSSVKSIVAYVEVWESNIFKVSLVSQLNGNPTLIKDWLTRIKSVIFFIKPKSLSATNHDTILNMGCEYRLIIY